MPRSNARRARRSSPSTVGTFLQRARQLTRQAGTRLPNWVRVWLKVAVPLRSDDRTVLEQIIFPHYTARPEISTVLFVGCDWYTAHYGWKHFAAKDYWTIDVDAKRRRFGARQHIVGALQELGRYFPRDFFQLIICNGVYGWGLNATADCDLAFSQCHVCLADGGHLMLGWNDVPHRDPAPLSSVASLRDFAPYVLPPLGTCHYLTDTRERHRFDFYRKDRRPAPAAP